MITLRSALKLTLLLIALIIGSCSFSNKNQNSQDKSKNQSSQDKFGEVTTENIIEERNIKNYNQGGHFYCKHSFNEKMNPDQLGEKKVCDFVNEHLKAKRLGYIRITCNGADVTNTFHIFIKPNRAGQWKIFQRMASFRTDGLETENEILPTEYDSLGCKKNTNSDIETWDMIYNIE